MTDSPIHFILTGGGITWQYARAIESASIHGREIWLWCENTIALQHHGMPAMNWKELRLNLKRLPLDLDRLGGTPQAHIWDLLAYGILYRHGGTCLGLDTISVRPMEPLADSMELGVGMDVPAYPYWHPEHRKWVDHPYNNNGISAPAGSSLAAWLYEEALLRILRGGPWGDTGPAILTELVEANRDRVQIAPFPQLCGWEGSHTRRFYAGEQPGEDVRVIHLFATAYPEKFESFVWNAALYQRLAQEAEA